MWDGNGAKEPTQNVWKHDAAQASAAKLWNQPQANFTNSAWKCFLFSGPFWNTNHTGETARSRLTFHMKAHHFYGFVSQRHCAHAAKKLPSVQSWLIKSNVSTCWITLIQSAFAQSKHICLLPNQDYRIPPVQSALVGGILSNQHLRTLNSPVRIHGFSPVHSWLAEVMVQAFVCFIKILQDGKYIITGILTPRSYVCFCLSWTKSYKCSFTFKEQNFLLAGL